MRGVHKAEGGAARGREIKNIAGRRSNSILTPPPNAYLPLSDHRSPHRACDLCLAEVGGTGVQYLADLAYPKYHSCADACDDQLLALVLAGRGYINMATITDMEAEAILSARLALWEGCVAALGEARALDVFGELSEKHVDAIIEGVWRAMQVSMRTQSIRGAIPVPLGEATLAERIVLDDELPF